MCCLLCGGLWSLFVAGLMFAVRCVLLFVICWLLFIAVFVDASCALSIACCSLLDVLCVSLIACCLFCAVYCVMLVIAESCLLRVGC